MQTETTTPNDRAGAVGPLDREAVYEAARKVSSEAGALIEHYESNGAYPIPDEAHEELATLFEYIFLIFLVPSNSRHDLIAFVLRTAFLMGAHYTNKAKDNA